MQNEKSLLTLLKIGFLSIIFIFSNVIFAADSKYLVSVEYPIYDPNNADHELIESNSDWEKINGTAHYYYVKPGDYRGAGRISLTADGTSSKKRYIILYNNNNTHPAKLTTSEEANVWLSFHDGGSYWVIDRMSSIGINTTGARVGELYGFYNGSSNNVLNRLHIKDYVVAMFLHDGCHNNTIQRSYMAEMTLAARKSDKVTIGLTPATKLNGTHITGTRILENEIVNSNDGVQLITISSVKDVHYDGTIIDNNLIWLTTDLYVTSVNGKSDSEGLFAYAENAIDLKAGSKSSDNPVVITNNIFWGFRQNAKDSDPGEAITIHHGFSYTVIENNVIFDSHRGIAAGAGGFHNSSIRNNIIYSCNKTNNNNYASFFYDSINLKIENNTIVDTLSGYGINIQNNTNSTFRKNLLISSGTARVSGPLSASNNYYYNTANRINGTGDISYTNASDSKMTNFSFTYDNYTNNPKEIVLPGVMTSSISPHFGKAGASITSVSPSIVSSEDNSLTSEDDVQGPWIFDYKNHELR